MPAPSGTESSFKIIIVGGSVAGLVLAHCLDRAGIKYVVLERNHEIAPQIGASVGIMPNGARILDQLDLFDELERETEPLVKSHICYPDGFDFSSAFPTLLTKRFGYSIAFLERQKLLEILYNRIKDKSNVHVGKKVTKIERVKNALCVSTKGGECYYGHVVVGADGVHSTVRAEMWRIADKMSPGYISSKEKMAMYAEYLCVFGISSPVPGLEKGEAIARFYDGLTILTNQGKGGRVYWFVLKKMEDRYPYSKIPRFDDIDAEKICANVGGCEIFEGVSFESVWNAREIHSISPLEENVFKHWNYDSIVCLGDSMHKMTPNLGQGANIAIESAAALANHLYDLIEIQGIRVPTNKQIDSCLAAFNNSRLERAQNTVKSAAFLTRLQARDGIINQFIGRYIVPYAGDYPANHTSNTMRKAPKLDYLPLPERVGEYWKSGHRQSLFAWENVKKAALFIVHACIFAGTVGLVLPAPPQVGV